MFLDFKKKAPIKIVLPGRAKWHIAPPLNQVLREFTQIQLQVLALFLVEICYQQEIYDAQNYCKRYYYPPKWKKFYKEVNDNKYKKYRSYYL